MCRKLSISSGWLPTMKYVEKTNFQNWIASLIETRDKLANYLYIPITSTFFQTPVKEWYTSYVMSDASPFILPHDIQPNHSRQSPRLFVKIGRREVHSNGDIDLTRGLLNLWQQTESHRSYNLWTKIRPRGRHGLMHCDGIETRPSRPIRCDVWIVEQIRYRQTAWPTNRHSQL